MSIGRLNDSVHLDFTTHNPTTGAVSDADSIPTVEVLEDDNDTAIVTPTATKRTEKTGNYRLTFDVTLANGFEINRWYNVVVSATVNGVSAKSVIASFRVESDKKIVGAVVADGSNTATTFKTDLSSAVTDAHKDALLKFISGTLIDQVKKISAYNGSTKFVTLSSAFTGIPSASDMFVVITE